MSLTFTVLKGRTIIMKIKNTIYNVCYALYEITPAVDIIMLYVIFTLWFLFGTLSFIALLVYYCILALMRYQRINDTSVEETALFTAIATETMWFILAFFTHCSAVSISANNATYVGISIVLALPVILLATIDVCEWVLRDYRNYIKK